LVDVKVLFMESHIIWATVYQFCQATPRPAVDVQLEDGRTEETHFTGQARVASARLYLQSDIRLLSERIPP
jgi:hypothetical protein